MKPFTSNKFLILIFILAVFLIGVLSYLILQSSQKNDDALRFEITNSNKDIKASNNSVFDPNKLDPSLLHFFEVNQVGLVKINFTEIPVAMLNSAYDSQNQPVVYDGFDIKQNERTLYVTIYVSGDAIKKLNKTDSDLLFDTTEQMFLSFSYYAERVKTDNQITLEQSNQTLTQRYKDAVTDANNLINNKNTPYVIHRIGN